jgi:hypothetical protein
MSKLIKDLFASDISRHIEEVIKVDQDDEQIVRDEIKEYVPTDSIRRNYAEILERYRETPNKPHEGIAVWVSGFFGSGKSSFAKMLGLALENRSIAGEGAAQLFGQQVEDPKIQVLLSNITEQIPTDAVIFDVSTDRGIRSGNQTITEITYRLFLQSLGYSRDLDLSELEITLETENRLDEFKAAYSNIFQKEWDAEKGLVAIAVQRASRVMHELDPKTFSTPDSWRESAMSRADITPGLLAERCLKLVNRRRPGHSLVFVIDEVGQFVARDVQKMLDLMGVVHSLGRVGRGKLWLVVTSQEKLTEVVSGISDSRIELARLMDRFPLQVHLEPSDISEVTSKRVLSKNAEGQSLLRQLFEEHRGRLTSNTHLTADIKLPELTAESFIDLYPLLPYQIDLIIQVVSGLRTQGGATHHVGGANRTIIKLAQQLLIHPEVNLANEPVRWLARIDQVYDLVAGNIASEIRGKIASIKTEVDHPLAQPVAKAICLLQYVKSIHRTAENIAAALHPSIDADSRLSEVNAALDALGKAHKIRLGQDGYRIPSPVEDDWEKQRSGLTPKPGEVNRIYSEAVESVWQPQPSHNFKDTKLFKAGLFLNGRQIVEGDIDVHLMLAEASGEYDEQVQEMRRRSQAETKSIFWTVALDEGTDRETVEVFRSREMLSKRERTARSKDETALVADERQRLNRHQDELKRRMRQACLTGTIYFRGNDRSPDERATDVAKTASQVLALALPEVFDRFEEAAARIKPQDLDSLLTTENLRGLTPPFTILNLVRDEGKVPVFNIETGPLAEVFARIANRTNYGETASGRWLADEFSKDPFGWEFDAVRLFVISLLRAGKIEATSKGRVIENALSLDAKSTFQNNNLFRQASFQTKQGVDFSKVVEAYDHFKEVFGREISELEQGVITNAIREELAKREEELHDAHSKLASNILPGAVILQETIDQIRAIRNSGAEHVIPSFNSSYKAIKEALKRSVDVNEALTDSRLHDLARAKRALNSLWPFLENEPQIEAKFSTYAAHLKDLLGRETFYKEFTAIDQNTREIEEEYRRRFDEAVDTRRKAYEEALTNLRRIAGWEALNQEQQELVGQPLSSRATDQVSEGARVSELRADTDACSSRLQKAIEEMMRMVDGKRLVRISASTYFSSGIENEEQLDASLSSLRDECARLIGSGKKVLVQ